MCIGQRVTLPNDGSISMNTTGFITDLKAWIDNNLEEKLDINTVADRAGYSNGTCSACSNARPATRWGSISACKN